MPIYEYRCEDGHTFEVMQRMADDPVKVCEVCGKPVQRVFHPVAVHYKGSGFYSTDYGKKGKKAADSGGQSSDGGSPDSSAGDAGESEGKSESKSASDSKSGSKSDSSKSESKSESKSDSTKGPKKHDS